MERARRWYDSPEYQAILPLRTDNAISDVIFVEGVGPQFTSREWAGAARSAMSA